VAFSDGTFNSTQSSGTSITGRIAAASDVTLDGVTVNPAAGDSAPTVIAGGNFVAGNTGHGGTLNGGVRYAGTIDVAQNFTVNGARTHAPPPFSFVSEFATLTESSHVGEARPNPWRDRDVGPELARIAAHRHGLWPQRVCSQRG
jgi:choice-of-anchor A domain-containing protein